MLKVAITGSTGLVGSRIIELLSNKFKFLPILQEEVDIADQASITQVINNLSFDVFLHLAAYTNVDKAETEQELAYKINAAGTKNVFNAVNQRGKKFIYISTDYVFDGKNPPYDENSVPNPVGTYGKSKYEGEKVVHGKAMIVRISYPYRANFAQKKDIIRTIKSRLEEQMSVKMINDTRITPTFIDDIAYGFAYLFENYSPEIFHLVGASSHTPFEVAELIADTFHLDKKLISKTTFNEYFTHPENRPRDTQIVSLKNNFSRMHTLLEGLRKLK